LFCAEQTSEVLSRPEGPASCMPTTRKRVVLFGSSSMSCEYVQAVTDGGGLAGDGAGLGILGAAMRAASALLATGTRGRLGRLRLSHSWHCASDWACE
jgi:hypothetical protein